MKHRNYRKKRITWEDVEKAFKEVEETGRLKTAYKYVSKNRLRDFLEANGTYKGFEPLPSGINFSSELDPFELESSFETTPPEAD